MRFILALTFLLLVRISSAQDSTSSQKLNEVTIRAFEIASDRQSTAAPVNHIDASILNRFGNASIVQAINASPGVRMEERSPGSYRLNIRGSSMRSPFGVRNVKIYYNDIPFTDAGGVSYLNQLGYYNIASIDILKGPGSNIYGAGTGGVVLINSFPEKWTTGAGLMMSGGSFGLLHVAGEVRLGSQDAKQIIRYQHLQSDGYRDQSAMRRDVLSWDVNARLGNNTTLKTHFLYSDLAYETPGALTLREYDSAPRMARPGVGQSPGAQSQQAAIYQKMFLAGITAEHRLSDHWRGRITGYGQYAQLYNPNIRNYSKSHEPNVGGRAVLQYNHSLWGGKVNWIAGAELQQNFTNVQTYSNKNGNPDTLQSDDMLRNRLITGFTQLSYDVGNWAFTAGISIYNNRFRYARYGRLPYQEQERNFNAELSPRLSILKKWNPAFIIYAIVAKGFSPPASTELSPSGGTLNSGLNPEQGWNYELGARGKWLDNHLGYDLNAFFFNLDNTIVLRRDAQGGDNYINSGNTRQQGIEASVNYEIIKEAANVFRGMNVFVSYTYNHFRYETFQQLNVDFSGKSLPGVPPHSMAAGLFFSTKPHLDLSINYSYTDVFYLNDANTDRNKSFHLLGFRLQYQLKFKERFSIIPFIGGDNLLDARYSLGPDINAFGGRYFNASPGRNFYGGLTFNFVKSNVQQP